MTRSITLLDQNFPFLPLLNQNRNSHASDGVIGTSSMQTAKAPSVKALAVSSQKANDKLLASEVNAM